MNIKTQKLINFALGIATVLTVSACSNIISIGVTTANGKSGGKGRVGEACLRARRFLLL
jgi:hypothetical protein